MSYESIAQYTGSSASGTFDIINFNSIPSTYKHLMVIGKVQLKHTSNTAGTMLVRFNSDSTATAYNWMNNAQVDNSSSMSAGSNSTSYIGAISPARATTADDNYSTFMMYIPDYASTSVKKSFWVWSGSLLGGGEQPAGEGRLWSIGGYWNNTSAINNLNFTSDTNPDFRSLTNLSLFGLKDI